MLFLLFSLFNSGTHSTWRRTGENRALPAKPGHAQFQLLGRPRTQCHQTDLRTSNVHTQGARNFFIFFGFFFANGHFIFWKQISARHAHRVGKSLVTSELPLHPVGNTGSFFSGILCLLSHSRARAIHLRKSREDGVGGFFTQIGPLYIVHHIWAYADLEARKDARDAAWSSPGWDDCVANTGIYS